jgi:hypothetical protein
MERERGGRATGPARRPTETNPAPGLDSAEQVGEDAGDHPDEVVKGDQGQGHLIAAPLAPGRKGGPYMLLGLGGQPPVPSPFRYRKTVIAESVRGRTPATLIHTLEVIEGPAADLGICPQAKDPGWTVLRDGDRAVITRVTTRLGGT